MRLLKLVVGMALVAGLSACGDDETPAAPQPVVDEKVGVKVTESDLGPILTDQKGRTLYGFVNDEQGPGACAADCVATWPAMISREPAAVGSGVDEKLLTQTDLSDGTKQVKYGKWPLYYYVGDTEPGDVDGQSVDGTWFVVAADGKLIKIG